MNLLILGGTVFLGRHLVEAARAAGHTVTLFNRGQHNPDLFPDVEKLPLHHKDPFDRLLIAQANAENIGILSADAIFKQYEVNGGLRLRCSATSPLRTPTLRAGHEPRP